MAEKDNHANKRRKIQVVRVTAAPPEVQDELNRLLKKPGEPGFIPRHRREQANGQNGKQTSWPMTFKIIIEKHADGYVAYPLDLKGVVVGQGDTYEDAVADVTSAIRFHIETFGNSVVEGETPVLEAFLADVEVGGSSD
jgi:predicted RNase H-like HicB family nuclease